MSWFENGIIFEWMKMGLAMQLPIRNLGYADYLPLGGEAGIGMRTAQTTSVTQEGLFYISFPQQVCLVDACFQLKHTSSKSQSVTQRSDIWISEAYGLQTEALILSIGHI